MIRRIQIDNFKSLDGFSLPPVGTPPLANFTCLIGANGSGKTSVLQIFDFLCYFMRGEVGDWLKDRGWEEDTLSSSFDSSPWGLFSVSVLVQTDSSIQAEWMVSYNLHSEECIEESITINGKNVLRASNGVVSIEKADGKFEQISGLSLRGSALEAFHRRVIATPLAKIKELFSKDIVTFELFSPESLKNKSQRSKNMGKRGENLAGFSAELPLEVRVLIKDRMQQFYPSIQEIFSDQDVLSKQFRQIVTENFLREVVPSSQFSDGFTRILAIVTQIESSNDPNSVLLIDEIENGIHPELMGKLIDYLVKSKVQVIVTTHSPLILNYLSDDQARDSVIFLYRNDNVEGRSRSCRYFDLPSTKKKLGILGPGEVYVDTSIEQLAREAEEMERGASAQAGATAQ